jgi:DNA invertase Pin-like site-specific DNA recombinase
MNQTKKFFLYARKSTDEPERQILSIEAQLFELRQFAKKENINIVSEFVESKTAKIPGREIFNDMVAQIEQGQAEGILAWHPDRLARNSVDGGRIIYLVDTGKISALKFPTFWFDPTPQGKFMLSIAFGQSKYYVDNLSENVKRGLRQKLRNGNWPAWAPLGYKNDKVSKKILIDKEKSLFIKKTFETYATGNYTLKEIRKIINNIGLVGKRNKLLSISNYQYLLTNPFYYGIMQYSGEQYEGKHEPIISKKLFEKVQEVMKQKSKPKTPELKPYVYRGVFHCGECGCFITTETKKGHNYLRCTKRKNDCSQKYLREEIMTEQIKKEIQKVSLSSDWAEKMIFHLENEKSQKAQSENSFAQELKDELKDCEQKLEILLDMILEKSISQDEYAVKKQKILNRKIEISEKLGIFEQKSNNRFEQVISFIKEANQAQNIAFEENPELIRDFLKKIGSNFLLTDRMLSLDFKNAWKILAFRSSAAPSVAAQNSKSVETAILLGRRDSNPRMSR